ncbi:MAG: hypothetical protein JWN88_3023 [Frankiales bacterium]|jgi:uncharacterized integral membrane protein|nr:hypothetical protein [Frankiales bacterium]
MIVLGVLLLVLAILVAIGIVLGNGEAVRAELFGVSLDNVSVGGLFLVGLVTGALAMLGLGLILAGAARKRAKKKAARREVSSVRGERESLAEENARLQAELERTTYASSTPVPHGDPQATSGAQTTYESPGEGPRHSGGAGDEGTQDRGRHRP